MNSQPSSRNKTSSGNKSEGLWVFGYGSLIWNPGFSYSDKREAKLSGWTLRFWQASMDHRGTPEEPGRVATLIAQPEATTHGMAYHIEGSPDEALAYLDHREQGGYGRMYVQVSTPRGKIEAVTYIGSKSAPEFIGPEAPESTARIISRARGPSGDNLYYFQELCKNLENSFSLSEYLKELRILVLSDHS